MTIHYRAAVLHRPHSPLQIETIAAAPIAPSDVLVRVRAPGLCHTDLEVIDGSLRYPMPIVLGHEAAGVIEEVGPAVRRLKKGDHVILSWNPHCGHCYLRPQPPDPVRGLSRQGRAGRCSSTAPPRRGARAAKSSSI